MLTRDEDIVDEACVEHAGAKSLIAQIKTMTSDQPLFDAKVKVLGESIDHHVKEEETEFFLKLARPRWNSTRWASRWPSARSS